MQEMEHYASDFVLSQEGYHSIDFTLLDRPSGSVVSAPEATASLLPDASFPSFDFADGAGVESFDDASLRNHGDCFRPGVLKHPDTRSTVENSVQSNSRIMHRQGVHDFFEQDNQQQPSDLGNWSWDGKRGSNDQSQLFYSGTYSAEEANGRNFFLSTDRFGTNTRMNLSGCAPSSSEVTNTNLGVSSMHSFLPTAGDSTDNRQSSQVKFGLTLPQEIAGSSVIRSQPRNQPMNVEGLWNISQNTQFKPSHPVTFGSSTLTNHMNSSSVGGLSAQVQNQNARFFGETLEGGGIIEPPSYGFLGSQVLLKGQGLTASVPGVAFGQQTGSSVRSAGLIDGQLLQQQSFLSQHQLQEMHRQLVLQQLKQHSEQVRQQQMQQQAYSQFPGISYSALLHGHDSPSPSPVPSPQPQPQPQPQLLRTSGGLHAQGLENHGPAFLAGNFTNANAGGPSFPLNGSTYYQGLTNESIMGQDPNLAWQLLASKGFQLDPSLQTGNARDGNGPVLTFYSGTQNELSEYFGGVSRLPTNSQVGKPVPRTLTPGTAVIPEIQTDLFGLYNGPSSDPKHTQQVRLKPFSGQHLQRTDIDSMEHNQISNSVHFMNMLSKSQNHFQDFQASEQRNWDSSERKWDAQMRGFSQPLKSFDLLAGNSPNAQESYLQNSSVQSLNDVNNRSRLAGTGQFLQQGSCQTGNSKPESVVGFKQQQYWSTPGMGTSIKHTDDESDRQNLDPWSSLQAQDIHSDSGSHGQLLPNMKRNIWGSNFPQQGSNLIGNSLHSIDSSKSRQITFHSPQSPHQATSKNGRDASTTIADTTFQSNQKSSYSCVDLRSSEEMGWKENERVSQTIQVLPSSLELDGQSQGSWKNHTSPIRSPDGVETKCQVADGDGRGSGWIRDFQQGLVETEAPYRMKLAPRKPNLANRQESQALQHANERLVTGGDVGLQQNQSQDVSDFLGTQHAVNVIRPVSDRDGELVANLAKDTEMPFHEKRVGSEVQVSLSGADVDLGIARNSLHPNKFFTIGKNPSMEKQKEPSESTDASASISLAHFRGNQSSSSLSPQSIRLGLGPPSNVSHMLQQAGNVNLSKFGHAQGLDGKLSGSVTADVQTHPYNSGYGSQIVGGDRGDIIQGAGNVLGTHTRGPQNSGESSSMQTSNIPSIISNENMQSEGPPPSNIMSKQQFLMTNEEEACIVAPSQFMISFENNKGALGSSQAERKLEENFDSTASQIWSNMGSCSYTQGMPSIERTAQPASMQDNPSYVVSSTTHNIQEHHMIKMVMQQLGERERGSDFSALLTSLKASLPGQSKFSADREKTFQGVFQSLQLPFGGIQGDQAPMLQDTQMNAEKSMTSGISCGEGLNLVPMTRAGSQNLLDECSDPSKAHQEKSFSILEASGLASGSSQPKFQEQNRQSLGQIQEALLNGGRPSSGGPGQGQDQQKWSNFFSTMAVPPRMGGQVRGSDKLDKVSSAFISQGQSVQQQTDASSEGLSLNQTSEGLPHSDARVALFSESAVKVGEKWNDAVKKPPKKQLKPGGLGVKANMKGSINQQVPHALAAPGQNKGFLDLKAMPQQNVSSPEVPIHSNAADDLPLAPGQLPTHAVGNLVVGVSSNSCMGKNINSTHTNVEPSCPSVPYLGSSTSEQSLATQPSLYHNLSAGGRALALSQHFLSKNPGQAVLYGGQSSHTPVGVADPFLKEGESRFFARSASAVVDQISHNHLSPLKSNLTFHPKKRKKQVPPLIPWHVAVTQPRSHLMSARDAELRWANATNRLLEKDDGECHDESISSVTRAKRRLRSTTQLMQQLIPLAGGLMHGNSTTDNECATYTLAKLALGEACRLVAGTGREAVPAQICVDNKNMAVHEQVVTLNVAKEAAMARIVESFMVNAKRLDTELSRLDCSTSALELTCEANDMEKLSIVNRLARHHGTGFSIDSSDNVYLENVSDIGPGTRRLLPQKYVTAVPMPRTLPEGVKCLSL